MNSNEYQMEFILKSLTKDGWLATAQLVNGQLLRYQKLNDSRSYNNLVATWNSVIDKL